MKQRFTLALLLTLLLVACDDLTSVLPDANDSIAGSGGLYILCDGNYSLNNSTLGLYSFAEKTYRSDFFQHVNGRKLGDTGNDLQRYGSKLYVVMNGSSQLEVLDARTGKSLAQLPFFDGTTARQPRAITFWKEKAYVCSFDGTVSRIDTSSLEVDGLLSVERNPDGIAASADKLYISNSGGLDYGSELGYDNRLSVVSTETFTLDKNIVVGLNPGRVKADNYGFVWVSVRGNYSDVPGSWVCVDTRTDAVSATFDFAVTNFDVSGEKAYFYRFDDATKTGTIGVFNLRTQTLETNAFVQDGTKIQTPYGITADPESGAVYITDAGDYSTSGDVCCFSETGILAYRLTNVGINPNTVLPVSDFHPIGGTHTDTVSVKGIHRVYSYLPAPGQFVGKYPLFTQGETAEKMRAKAESTLRSGGLVTLGRFGGSVVFSFEDAVNNRTGSDFRILGNAFSTSAEPGIVEVSRDDNGNGLPDDAWYELAGSEYAKAETRHGCSWIYYKPSTLGDSVLYRNELGETGFVKAGYPFWQGDSLVCKGSMLAPPAYRNEQGFWISNSLPWGYADNQPNLSGLNGFDLDWAVDEHGNRVTLTQIHFIRVYTAVNQDAGWMGELSTEVLGAENLHP
jgi:DNA-binding beta-propeller fold protein YncE